MTTFTDQMFIRFLEDVFVEDLLKNQIGLPTFLNLTYESDDIEIKEIDLESIRDRQFQMPTFETIRTKGTEERIMPTPERIQVNHEQSRYGRLSWIEVFLNVLLSTKVHSIGAPIEKITTKNLLTKIGGASSITDLKNKLKALYPDSVVDTFFKKFRISTVEEFKRRCNLFMEFIFQTPPPYDPSEPQNARIFKVNICVKFQPEFKIAETLQEAKLCRSILENEKDFAETFDGGTVKVPYVFLIIFPDGVIKNNDIPGMTAAQIKTSIKGLFSAENMVAYFIT